MRGRLIVLSVSVIILGFITVFGGLRSAAAQTTAGSESHVVVEAEEDTSIAHGLADRVQTSWPWYLTRASGVVAAVTMVILMLSGIGLLTGHTFKFLEPITAWASHRALGIAFAVSVLLHVIPLLFDHFVPFSILGILVPFASDFKPTELFGINVGSLWIAIGVLSLYMVIAITLTSLLWIEKKPKLWKWTHLLSYLAMIFVFFHGLYLGTDFSSGLLRWVWIASGFALLLATLARLWRAKTV